MNLFLSKMLRGLSTAGLVLDILMTISKYVEKAMNDYKEYQEQEEDAKFENAEKVN